MSDEQSQLLNGIRVVIRLSRIAQQVCEEAGLNLAQYRALNSARHGGRRAFELAQTAAVSRPAITSLTSGMIQSGLIAKQTSESDGRGVVFVVTPLGTERLLAVERLLVDRFTEALGESRSALVGIETAALDAALDQLADRDFGLR